MADDIIRSRAHVLSAREEQLMAMVSPALESLDGAFSMLESVDLKLGTIRDEKGQEITLTHGLFGKLRDSRDRRVRADAFAAMHNAFAGVGNTIAALYSGSVRADLFSARARDFESGSINRFFRQSSRSVYTGLIEAVRSHLPMYHHYFELHGVRGVGSAFYDTYVPLTDEPTEYNYNRVQIVRRAS